MTLDKFENNFFKKQSSHNDFIVQCENGFNLPSKALIEIKSHNDASGLELSLECLKESQSRGFSVVVDGEFNLSPEYLLKRGIDLKSLLYVPATEPTELYEILFKLLESKELRLIVVNTVTMLFSLIYDSKELTINFTKLRERVQKSNASVIIVNPYHDLGYNVLCNMISYNYGAKYIKSNKDGSIINVDDGLLFNIYYNHI